MGNRKTSNKRSRVVVYRCLRIDEFEDEYDDGNKKHLTST